MTSGRTVHVVLGTKAQYIKTAPLIRRLVDERVPHRLVDLGQHGELTESLRSELGIGEPDLRIGGSSDVSSIPQAARWAAGLAGETVSPRKVRQEIFAGRPGAVLVHGDTPSTLLGAMLARRARLPLAHLEAGLRSGRITHPFPEEAIRVAVMRRSDLLLAPDGGAVANLRRMRGVHGRVVRLPGNTGAEALHTALGSQPIAPSGPAVVTCHRVENLHRQDRLRGVVDLAVGLGRIGPVRFVVHGPTSGRLASLGLDRRLREAGVETVELQPYPTFVRSLAAAWLVVTDGGSIQEECARLGVPTLLWRAASERPDGLGANIRLTGYDVDGALRVAGDPEALRRPPQPLDEPPSAVAAAELARLACLI